MFCVGRILIYGGKGVLGFFCVSLFKFKNYVCVNYMFDWEWWFMFYVFLCMKYILCIVMYNLLIVYVWYNFLIIMKDLIL